MWRVTKFSLMKKRECEAWWELTTLSIKKGRIERPEGFLRLLVPMEQERHIMAVPGCAEGLCVCGERVMNAFGSEHWEQKFSRDHRNQWLGKKQVRSPWGRQKR